MKITILGPQGSGKSTYAKMLADKLNVPFIGMGDLIREACSHADPSIAEACRLMQEGDLVPDDLAGSLLSERLERPDCTNGFVLDGYPRQLSQLDYFFPELDKVIFVDIPLEIGVERLLKRGRVDDTYDGIHKRLEWYQKETPEVLKYFEDQGLLVKVDGRGDITEVFENILKAL